MSIGGAQILVRAPGPRLAWNQPWTADGRTHLIDVIEIAAFFRPVAVTQRHAVLTETSQVHDHDAALLPDHLHTATPLVPQKLFMPPPWQAQALRLLLVCSFVCLSVRLSVCYKTCEYDILKTNQPILMHKCSRGKLKNYSMRKRGHPFQLPVINTTLLKSTFVNRCLF